MSVLIKSLFIACVFNYRHSEIIYKHRISLGTRELNKSHYTVGIVELFSPSQ